MRLFDKGEMNTYKDGLSLVQTVNKCTRKLLSTLVVQNINDQPYCCTELSQKQILCIKNFLNQKCESLCRELESKLKQINSLVLKDTFLNKRDYKMDLVCILRKFNCLAIIKHGILNCCDQVEVQHVNDMCNVIKHECALKFKSDIVVLNHVLKETMQMF